MSFEPDERAIYIRLKLPETPRVGEYIDLAFLEGDNHTRGFVNEVRHSIYGNDHEINVYIHPFNNYYHQWDKMKRILSGSNGGDGSKIVFIYNIMFNIINNIIYICTI